MRHPVAALSDRLPCPARRAGPAAHAGFTLIEVLAAVFLTSIVISVALAFFIGLSRSTEAAAAKTQDGRRALAVLDRVARDLEGAYLLVKPPNVDPLSHPWLFVGESSFSTEGADRVMFTSRNYRPRNPVSHGSDLGVITYVLHPEATGNSYELLRSISPGLPEALDREFPSADDERMVLVATGLSHFALNFMSDAGEWQDAWDSSLILESSTLPLAVEIELAFAVGDPEEDEEGRVDEFEFANADEDAETYTRTVKLPMRPVDLAAMLEDGTAGQSVEDEDFEEGDEEGENDESDESDLLTGSNGDDSPITGLLGDDDEEGSSGSGTSAESPAP